MRKNYFVICVTMMCLLVLVGCTSLKVGTEVPKNPVTESQGNTEKESQKPTEAETQVAEKPTEAETQAAEKPTETEKPEVPSSGTAEAQENEPVKPLPVTIDLNHLEDCIIAVSLDKGDVYRDKSGAVQMDVTVYVYDLYDMVDIALLKEGDTILLRQKEVVIDSIERKDNGAVLINGGLDVGGYELYTSGNTVYYERGYSDTKFYYELGKVTLPVSDKFIYNDASDLDKDAVIYHAEDFLKDTVGLKYYFGPNNTTIQIEGGYVTEMTMVYVP